MIKIVSSFLSEYFEEHEIMEACYVYVTSDPFFHNLWPWQSIVDLLPNLSCKKAKWFTIEIISELCSIGQLSKKSMLQKMTENTEDISVQNCLEYLYKNQNSLIKTNSIKTTVPEILSDSLCSIENVLLPSIGTAIEDLSFVTLPNRRRILEEIANNIAERKHTFLSVSVKDILIKSYLKIVVLHRFKIRLHPLSKISIIF